MTTINLHELAKERKLRAAWDDAREGRNKDPYLMIIRGTFGHVYLHGRHQLAFSTNTRSRGVKMAREIEGVEIVQNGDDGINATFPLAVFDEVARRLRLYRKRQLTPEQRENSAKRLAAYARNPHARSKISA